MQDLKWPSASKIGYSPLQLAYSRRFVDFFLRNYHSERDFGFSPPVNQAFQFLGRSFQSLNIHLFYDEGRCIRHIILHVSDHLRFRKCYDLVMGIFCIEKELRPKEFLVLKQLHSTPGAPFFYCSYRHKERDYIIEPYYPFTLDQYLRTCPLDEQTKLSLCYQLLSVLKKLHTIPLQTDEGWSYYAYHGDIKPNNILISADGVLALIDFEEAAKPKEFHGTLEYIAPEYPTYSPDEIFMFLFNREHSHHGDIWATGLIMLDIVRGKDSDYLDNYTPDDEDIARKLEEAKRDFPQLTGVCSLIEEMLHPHPYYRPMASDALGFVKILQRLI